MKRVAKITAMLVALALCGIASAGNGSGAVAHWKFDEGSGDIAYDSAGNNDGTIYGAQWTDGVLGGALDFDSRDDYVSINPITLSTNWTLAVWVKPFYSGGGSETHNPVIGGPGTYTNYVLLNHMEGYNYICFETKTSDDYALICRGVVNASIGQWAHYTITRKANTVSGYKNGVFVDDDTLPTGDDNTITKIASGYGTVNYFDGHIDDVRIYERPLTAEEIQQLYEEAVGGLIAHWKFDEGSGGIAYDSANNYDGTVFGAQWTTGLIDGALDFDGEDDYVALGDIDEFEFGDRDYSISAWFYTKGTHYVHTGPGTHHEGIIVSKYNWSGGGRQWFLSQLDSGMLRFFTSPDGSTHESLYSLDGGYQHQWVHVTGVRSSSTKQLYINGALDNSGATAGVVTGKSPWVYVGCMESPDVGRCYFFNGAIDDVRIYERALTADEIKELYQSAGPIPPVTYYVDGVNGSDKNDGLSPDTAFATIGKGMDTANDGDTVVVFPDSYEEDIDFAGKNITVTSVEPTNSNVVAGTTIEGWVQFRGTEDASCTLAGFDIDGSIAGVDWENDPNGENHTHATISHCTLKNNVTGCGRLIFGCDGTIRNCVIADTSYMCLVPWPVPAIVGCHGRIENCTIARAADGIEILPGGTCTMKNCIIYYSSPVIVGSGATLNISYCDLEGGLDGVYGGGTVNWGPGNIDTDPCFARLGNGQVEGDYHVKSQAGRWKPAGESWVKDDVTSGCIDAADPNDDVGDEVHPNGGIINMGAYGGTAEASKTFPCFAVGMVDACGQIVTGADYDQWMSLGAPECWCEPCHCRGDANGDCTLNAVDVLALRSAWPGLGGAYNSCCDVNYDGAITAIDVLVLRGGWPGLGGAGCSDVPGCK